MSNPLCFYCLSALVHCRNPDITENPTTIEAGGTRVEQHKETAINRAKEYAAAKSVAGTVRGEMEEKHQVARDGEQ
jgi:hypothetical protein